MAYCACHGALRRARRRAPSSSWRPLDYASLRLLLHTSIVQAEWAVLLVPGQSLQAEWGPVFFSPYFRGKKRSKKEISRHESSSPTTSSSRMAGLPPKKVCRAVRARASRQRRACYCVVSPLATRILRSAPATAPQHAAFASPRPRAASVAGVASTHGAVRAPRQLGLRSLVPWAWALRAVLDELWAWRRDASGKC